MATSYLELARSIAQQKPERSRSDTDFVYEENEENEVIPLHRRPGGANRIGWVGFLAGMCAGRD